MCALLLLGHRNMGLADWLSLLRVELRPRSQPRGPHCSGSTSTSVSLLCPWSSAISSSPAEFGATETRSCPSSQPSGTVDLLAAALASTRAALTARKWRGVVTVVSSWGYLRYAAPLPVAPRAGRHLLHAPPLCSDPTAVEHYTRGAHLASLATPKSDPEPHQ
jgi:hypothetical protein